ncbi:MAG: hypothetical protein ACF8NJ_02585, partial [Phycisphaerales bacterium JB038]
MTPEPNRRAVPPPGVVALLAVGLFVAPMAAEETDSAPLDSPAPPAAFGQAESWWWTTSAAVGLDVLRDSESYTANLAATYFLVDDFSLEVQGSLHFLDQEREDAFAGSLALLFRQHWWLADEKTTFFLDAGVGLLAATDDIPEEGAEYGLTPQFGAGLTFPVG